MSMSMMSMSVSMSNCRPSLHHSTVHPYCKATYHDIVPEFHVGAET